MTGKQIVARIVLGVLVIGLLAGAGYAIFRLGFNAGLASAPSMGEMRGFISEGEARRFVFDDEWRGFPFEREPRFGFPDRFQPRSQEPLRPASAAADTGEAVKKSS